MSNAEKLKALKLTMDKIDKDFGKGSVMMMNERSQEPQEVVSTGSIGLDAALGIGGLPRGRVVEIYGPESSGKTVVIEGSAVIKEVTEEMRKHYAEDSGKSKEEIAKIKGSEKDVQFSAKGVKVVD